MIQAIEAHHKTAKVIVTMTVPIIASLLVKQQRVTDIANLLNQSTTNVSKYIKRHYDRLAPLIDDQDVLAAMHSKYIAQRAKDKIDDIFDSPETYSKRDLIPLTAVSDRHTQQYRLLSDKSTQNVNMATNEGNIDDQGKANEALRKANEAVQDRLDKLTGSPEEIIDV